MPRFFFNYRRDENLIADSLGVDLPDIAAAHVQAAEFARVMLAKAVSAGESPSESRCIEIIDEQGTEVLYVVFWASAPGADASEIDDQLKLPTVH